jgi:uncharacterized protein YcgI (DUF1989 family)
MNDSVTISCAHSRAFHLKQYNQIKITNLEGSQVVDAWAFCESEIQSETIKP